MYVVSSFTETAIKKEVALTSSLQENKAIDGLVVREVFDMADVSIGQKKAVAIEVTGKA